MGPTARRGSASPSSRTDRTGRCLRSSGTVPAEKRRADRSSGACDPGFFDFEPGAFGCETTCAGSGCTLTDGGVISLTAAPVPETGLVFSAFASGGSHGAAMQSNAGHTNVGLFGEPPPATGSVRQGNANHQNSGGFNSALQKK